MILALVTLSLLGDVAPFPGPRSPPPPPAQCNADVDCVLSTFNGCCGGCCGSDPHAVPAGVNEAARCAVVDCDMPDCSAVKCRAPRPLSDFVAACRGGRCVAVPKVEAPPQCRVDADCRVVTSPAPESPCHRSPCGCCPATRAVPADAVVPLQQRPAPQDSKAAPAVKPDFGLSTGGPVAPQPPQAPNCAACPQPTPGTAACQAGRCVLRPVSRRPIPPG